MLSCRKSAAARLRKSAFLWLDVLFSFLPVFKCLMLHPLYLIFPSLRHPVEFFPGREIVEPYAELEAHAGEYLLDLVERLSPEVLRHQNLLLRLLHELPDVLDVRAHFDALSAKNLVPHLPQELAAVPRANIDFLPIKEAWFSGSMNYIGRARNASGSPLYEASYEINASLEISYPEFEQLVSHEVVPGHVTTFAYLQDLYVRGKAGFEATVLTMNTRAATLFEGIANNAIHLFEAVEDIGLGDGVESLVVDLADIGLLADEDVEDDAFFRVLSLDAEILEAVPSAAPEPAARSPASR